VLNFYLSARRFAVRPTVVRLTISFPTSRASCKASITRTLRLRRGTRRPATRETCAKRYSARLLTLISVTGEARVARTPGLGNGT